MYRGNDWEREMKLGTFSLEPLRAGEDAQAKKQ
jgi:hypothetical protein